MPCRTEEPDWQHVQKQKAAKLTVAYLRFVGANTTDQMEQNANDAFCNYDWAPFLCNNLRGLKERDPKAFEKLVYSAKSKQSREFADWWEQHDEEDKARREEEEAILQRDKIVAVAKKKLSKEEWAAIVNYFQDE